MRLSIQYNVEYNPESAAPRALLPPDPGAPDLSFLTRDFTTALRSFLGTIDRITADNPVAIARLQELAGKARLTQLAEADARELQSLKLQALRQGRAVGAAIGFFLKFKPYPMLEEIRRKGPAFQPPIGPLLVVDGDAVRDVFERDQEFTVEPYGVEMMKATSRRASCSNRQRLSPAFVPRDSSRLGCCSRPSWRLSRSSADSGETHLQ